MFELSENPNGTHTLREQSSGEVMHSRIGPWEEATLLYTGQAQLERLLRVSGPPLVLYDVGLGTGANAIAAIELVRGLDHRVRPLHLVSFETRPEGLAFALGHGELFPYLARNQAAVRSITGGQLWEEPGVLWELRAGDFFEQLEEAPHAEVIFYDFYAPRTCPSLWSEKAFQRLRSHCSPRGARLLTYSAATAVRVALLLAGFRVGYGSPTGAKRETTEAATLKLTPARPLGQHWLEHLRRSGSPFPLEDPSPPDREQLIRTVSSLRQFT